MSDAPVWTPDRTIALVGLMGAGKSAIGRRLANRLGLPFMDADTEIETAAGCTIEEFFERFGEAEFRAGERRVIARLLEGKPHVLATGGGAFMDPLTRAAMRDRATTVWLRADLAVLIDRVGRRGHRPLLKRGEPREILERLIAVRYPVYAEADIVVESRDAPAERTTDDVMAALHARAARQHATDQALAMPGDAAIRRLSVDLADRPYDILIGPGLIADAGRHCRPFVPKGRAIVVTDDNVARLHLEPLVASLAAAGIAAPVVTVPAGEPSKTFESFGRLMEQLLDQRPDRGTVLIALGGGVVGDLTGFAASVLLRGVDFIQIPTTLLAQVDSSVGGKTGINTRHGKNLVGAFHQPRLVLADTGVLDTLPRRELLAGYAEVAKYGLIDDEPFFAWLEANAMALLDGDAALRTHAIAHSCAAKARIVRADERETAGVRDLLNLGHTFAHALEAETGYGDALLHGEAVGIGMALAFDMSVAMGLCPEEDSARARAHLAAVGLAVSPRGLAGENARGWDPSRLVEHMSSDKKNRDGKLTFILARGIGQSFVERGVEPEHPRATFARALAT